MMWFEHNVRTLEHARVKELSLELRLAALLHDISKPETRLWSKEKGDWTFYTHEVVGAHVARKILKRMKFSNDIVSMATLLVRWHMFLFRYGTNYSGPVCGEWWHGLVYRIFGT